MGLTCSKYLKKDPETNIMYFERSRLHHVAQGQITDLASALFKSTGVVSKSSVVQKHLSQQGYLCSPGTGIITFIIHIDFTDGIYRLL